MGQEIKTSLGAVLAAQGLLGDSVETFCSFRLANLSTVLPVSASADHDLRLAALMRDALGAYGQMVSRDASSVQGLHEELAACDQALSSGWGMDGSCES